VGVEDLAVLSRDVLRAQYLVGPGIVEDLSETDELIQGAQTRARYAAVSKHEDAAKIRSVHAEVHNHFNQERHLVTRQVYKQRRAGALAEWRALAA
jgi:hypothetical protein